MSPLRPVEMAMHIHSSLSEGTASYAAHLAEAERLGVDVIWWSDHDFRIAAHGYRKAVGFDGPVELENELEWSWSEVRDGELITASAEFVDQPHTPNEPGRALRLSARGSNGELWQAGTAWNWTYSTSLADTIIELDLLAEDVGPSGVLALRIECSYHPAIGGRPAGQYLVRYEFGGVESVRRSTDGLTGIVELPLPIGQWHRVALQPVVDIAALWPDLVAEDNSLHQLRIGAIARGGDVSGVVDRLRFQRSDRQGQDGLDLRRRILKLYDGRFTSVRRYESMEISLVRHLNWFGGTIELPDWEPGPPLRQWEVEKTAAMVRFVHERGGLVSYNHPMEHDVAEPEALAERMINTGAMGCDLVELGRHRKLDQLLQVLDITARNAIFYTATGVTDDHEGRDWPGHGGYLTGVWANSAEEADLLAALRSGRAWFADPARWRGQLSVIIGDQDSMGGVLVGADGVNLTVSATELPAGARLEVITGPVDLAGVAELRPAGTVVTTDRPTCAIELPPNHYLRAQVRAADGTIVGVGNPVWSLADPAPVDVPPERLLGRHNPAPEGKSGHE